jgi:hypothetical protein
MKIFGRDLAKFKPLIVRSNLMYPLMGIAGFLLAGDPYWLGLMLLQGVSSADYHAGYQDSDCDVWAIHATLLYLLFSFVGVWDWLAFGIGLSYGAWLRWGNRGTLMEVKIGIMLGLILLWGVMEAVFQRMDFLDLIWGYALLGLAYATRQFLWKVTPRVSRDDAHGYWHYISAVGLTAVRLAIP